MHFYQEKKCGNSWQRSQCSGNSETLAGSHHLGNSSLLHSLKSSVCAKASSLGFQSVASFQERSQQHPCRRVNRDGKIARKQRGDSPILVSLCQRKSVIREENMGFLNSGKRQGHAFNLRKKGTQTFAKIGRVCGRRKLEKSPRISPNSNLFTYRVYVTVRFCP